MPLMLPDMPASMNVASRLSCTSLAPGVDVVTAKLPSSLVRSNGTLMLATPGAFVRSMVS